MTTATDRPNSGPRTAKHALIVPLAVLGVMVLFIGLIATVLLFNTKTGALVFAAVAAGGVLFSVSLLASRDRLDRGQRFAAVGAGVLPLLVGGLVAAGLIGGIDPADQMRNVQPLEVVPEDAPIIAAENSNEFCLPDGAGGCEPTDTWQFAPSTEVDDVAFVFDNRDTGVLHNVVITTLEGGADAPEPGDELLASEVITGPDEEYFASEVPLEELPEEFYFFCAIHPATMTGTGTLAAE
ncbi:MAG: hypothetical protein WEB09_05565 [Nitriliruptor sp.]